MTLSALERFPAVNRFVPLALLSRDPFLLVDKFFNPLRSV